MDLETIQRELSSIPEVRATAQSTDEGDPKTQDLLGVAMAFTKTLRKLGVQHMRDSRDLLTAIQEPRDDLDGVRDAWQREQKRATESERQLDRMTKVLIAVLDTMNRLHSLLEEVPGQEDWARQVARGIELCHQDAQRAGLVALSAVGDLFDSEVHDLETAVPRDGAEIRIGSVTIQGYALNGRVIRRATVQAEG